MRIEFLKILQFLAVKLHILAVKCGDFRKFTAYSCGEIT